MSMNHNYGRIQPGSHDVNCPLIYDRTLHICFQASQYLSQPVIEINHDQSISIHTLCREWEAWTSWNIMKQHGDRNCFKMRECVRLYLITTQDTQNVSSRRWNYVEIPKAGIQKGNSWYRTKASLKSSRAQTTLDAVEPPTKAAKVVRKLSNMM